MLTLTLGLKGLKGFQLERISNPSGKDIENGHIMGQGGLARANPRGRLRFQS